ncbi:MAG: hypothetical protein CL424_17800 [Acidimicrobiaceae bacterium]|nr:hypothetical protein [Acidimicrobiaceae bacterium]
MTRLRGLGAFLVVVTVVAGLPWLLVRYGDWPLTSVPTGTEVGDLANSVVSDSMVFAVLTVAVWAVWVAFTASAVVEVVASARGIQAPRLTIVWPIQRSARVLVAAIVLAVTISSNSPVAVARPHATPVAAPLMPPSDSAQIGTAAAGGKLPGSPEVVTPLASRRHAPIGGDTLTVQRGDSAWSIAEEHLGDGMRWRDLWAVNQHQPQPDGGAWTDPQVIRPGWVLRLPDLEAKPRQDETGSPDTDGAHIVEPGDTLTAIAREHLGDPSRFVEIYELNRDLEQPDGGRLSDPDIILPGWQLRLPSSTAPAPPTTDQAQAAPIQDETLTNQPAATGSIGPPADAHASKPPTTPTTPTTSPATAPPTPTTVATPSPSRSAEPRAEPAGVERPAPSASRDGRSHGTSPTTEAEKAQRVDHGESTDDQGGEWLAPTITGLAGLSTAIVLATGLLARLRTKRRGRLTRGASPDQPASSRVEREVTVAADVPLVRWAGQALAQLLAQLDPKEAGSSAPVAVELSEESGIELLWDTPRPTAPSPWTAADEGWAWRLAYDPDGEVPVDELPAAIPALVTIGERQGRQLLLDLEAYGSITVVGDPERVGDFLRAVALELSSGDDLSDAYVVAVGLDPTGMGDRLSAEDMATASARAAAVNESVREVLKDAEATSSFSHRCGADGAHLEVTVIVISDSGADADGAIGRVQPRSGLAVIAADAQAAGATIRIEPDGSARIEPLGVSFQAAGIPASTATVIEELVEDAGVDTPADEPGGEVANTNGDRPQMTNEQPALFDTDRQSNGDGNLPDGASDQGRASPLDAALVVKVLGTPHVPDRPSLKRREIILTAFLACRGGQVNASAVQDALWNGQAVQGKTVWNLVGRTRTALGHLPDGTWVMPASDRNMHMKGLAPGVTTDLEIFRRLYDLAQDVSSSEAIGHLRRALALVEGPPFDAAGYDWAYHGTQDVAEASQLIEQAAEQLANLALDDDNVEIAREAVTQGLKGLPGDEVLYRLRMRVEHHVGNLAGIAAAYDELLRHLAEFDTEPSPSTIELHRALLGSVKR